MAACGQREAKWPSLITHHAKKQAEYAMYRISKHRSNGLYISAAEETET